jgi:hypothetical protein
VTPRRALAGLATIALTATLIAGRAAGMTVLPLDLAALTEGAGTIFVGRVARVDPGVDERGIAAVWTTFEVDEALKGDPGRTLIVKQLGAPFGRGTGFPSVPRFAPGEPVMLFVHAPSALGFASPVGLGQGAFRIRERGGRRVVENDVAHRNLDVATPAGARAAAAPSADLPLDTLVARVRALVDGTR